MRSPANELRHGHFSDGRELPHSLLLRDWILISHSHGKHGSRDIDTFEIKLADGTPLTVYFDCTESFGKWPPSPTGSVGRVAQRRSEDTLP
jgi:hypothetical protein